MRVNAARDIDVATVLAMIHATALRVGVVTNPRCRVTLAIPAIPFSFFEGSFDATTSSRDGKDDHADHQHDDRFDAIACHDILHAGDAFKPGIAL